jgi:peptidoglycan/LPS O-acetylase OafA/YrhL
MRGDVDARRTHYDFLDGLRGVAAIAVLIGHLKQTGAEAQQGNFGMAVDLFFILSGFVVMHAYGRRLADGLSFWTFVKLRVIRLWPMLAVATVAGLLLAAMLVLRTGEGSASDLSVLALLGLLCLPVIAYGRSDAAFPLNPPQWSLFFEFAANFAFAAVGRWMDQRLAWTLAASGAVLLVVAAMFFGYTDTGSKQADLLGGGARVLFGFFCGVAVYMAGRLGPLGPGAGAVITGVVAVALWPWWDAPVAVRLGVILVLFPAIIHAGASVEVSGVALAACRFLGVVSYPLYIIHTPLMGVTGRVIAQIDPAGTYLGWCIAAQAILFIVASWLLARLFDEPVRALLNRLVRRATRNPVP